MDKAFLPIVEIHKIVTSSVAGRQPPADRQEAKAPVDAVATSVDVHAAAGIRSPRLAR